MAGYLWNQYVEQAPFTSTLNSPTVNTLSTSPQSISTPAAWQAINSLRVLAMDAVQQANSGHPGTPMGLAPAAWVLWRRHLKHAPNHPDWADRDRFVLSCGHASMLLYGLLHLSGYGLTLDDIKSFRQWGSLTPGHPEHGHTVGVETTTGPLGQGISTAVGMALAESYLAKQYNGDGAIVDHRTWVIASDGDLMEGVASEAASLAGHLRLGKLTVLYDANHITIDGRTDLSFTEDVARRFEAYGWRTLHVADGNDLEAIDAALSDAGSQAERPTLIVLHTIIGDPAPTRRDSSKAHGEPLGSEEIARTKAILGWPSEPFYVPAEAYAEMAPIAAHGDELVRIWEEQLAAHPRRAEFLAQLAGTLPAGWEKALPELSSTALASRQASHQTLDLLTAAIPGLVGGSADLAGSTGTKLSHGGEWTPLSPGATLHFGIREHGMTAAMNGMALHGGIRPYGATFLVFADYAKPAIRLAALMRVPTLHIFTHDSIGLGEDGPTHQPIEHLAMLRSIPNLCLLRPADSAETVAAWKRAIEHQDGPVALVLTRQKLPPLTRNADPVSDTARGGYILQEPAQPPRALIIATGSEVQIAVAAAVQLDAEGIPTRVVSLPSWELFTAQDQAWRDRVLPPAITARVSIEAASPFGWERWVGQNGTVIGINHFGASAPAGVLFKQFGFTSERVADAVRALVLPREKP